jgi:hypothetical protein
LKGNSAQSAHNGKRETLGNAIVDIDCKLKIVKNKFDPFCKK